MKKALAACLLLLSLAAPAAGDTSTGAADQSLPVLAAVLGGAWPALMALPGFDEVRQNAMRHAGGHITLVGALGYYVLTRPGWREAAVLVGTVVGIGLAFFDHNLDPAEGRVPLRDSATPVTR